MIETKPVRVVHYLNQFFGGIGGEDKAGIAPYTVEGAVGPGRLLEQSSNGSIKVIGTVICGDNYFVEEPSALIKILELIRPYKAEGFIAGPAFAAGRYGEACTSVSSAVKEELSIPVITGLDPASPAVERYRQQLWIVKTGNSAVDMKKSMPRMGSILYKKVCGESLSKEEVDYLVSSGLKKNIVWDEHAAKRAVQMALSKYYRESWKTEVPMVKHEQVPPAEPIRSKVIKLALVTDGGLVQKGNPERMSAVRSKKWCQIDATSWSKLSEDLVDVNHGGYDTRLVAADPNRLIPLDVVRELEKEGQIELHPYIYSTAGVATAIEDAAGFGREIAIELRNAGIQAAILTST